MNQVLAPAKGKHGAEHCVADAGALALARTGRSQAAAYHPRATDLAPAIRATRDDSKLPGGASRVGSRLRKCRRRKKERHGSARASQGPGGLCAAFNDPESIGIVRTEYSAITKHEWKLLLYAQKVLDQSRYAAYIFRAIAHGSTSKIGLCRFSADI